MSNVRADWEHIKRAITAGTQVAGVVTAPILEGILVDIGAGIDAVLLVEDFASGRAGHPRIGDKLAAVVRVVDESQQRIVLVEK